jgi:hypothetical protein
MADSSEKLVYSKNVVELITVAGEYCKFIEKVRSNTRRDFVDKSLKILSLLYLKSAMIQDFELEMEGESEKFVTEVQWEHVKEMVSEKLGLNEIYVDVIAPGAYETQETESISLSECFADMYQDLKDLVGNFEIGAIDAKLEAIYDCKYNFEVYWGPRLLSALTYLHSIRYSETEWDDEQLIVPEIDQTQETGDDRWISQVFKKKPFKDKLN